MTTNLSRFVLANMTPEARGRLLLRAEADLGGYLDKVRPIIDEVRQRGDAALSEFAKQLDGAPVPADGIRVTEAELDRGCANVPAELAKAILYARDNILRYHQTQLPKPMMLTPVAAGVLAGERWGPIPSVACYVPRGKGSFPSVCLMTLIPAVVAAWHRIRTGREPATGDGADSHAAWFLAMLEGTTPSPDVARVMDLALTLHADHEFNASTFAARVAVATRADLHSAIVAAIATLKGPSHGGANEDVLLMLREIGDPAKAEAFVDARLGTRGTLSRQQRTDPKSRMPGFGHRVYRVDDARARVLRGMAKSLAEATGRQRLFEVAERVYDTMRARTTLPVNVDFFSAVVYDALNIPPDLCTSIFAIGRVAGWCAHAMEQYADNRLIRPRADYTGPQPRSLPAAGR